MADWGNVGKKAAIGAAVGSVLPGLGTVTGGLIGGAMGFFGGDGEEDEIPTMGKSVDEWLAQLPKLMGATEQYAPQQAGLQFGLTSEYAPQYAQLQQSMLREIMPETYGLQEQMAGQVSEGLSGELTDSERRQFLDLQKSLVGEQSTSGIGTDYIGSNLLNYIQNRKAQSQNLGMGLLGNLNNIQTGYQPSYTDFLGGNQANLLSSSLGYPAFQAQFDDGGFNIGGALSGAVSGASAGAPLGPYGMIGGAAIGGLGGGFA